MHRFRLSASLLGLGLVLAACSSGGGGAASTATVAPASQPPASQAPASQDAASPSAVPASDAPAAGGATVNLAETSLGSVLVDGEGMTLYIFTADTDGTSVCYDDCAKAWPPLLSDATATAGAGVDAAKLGSVDRTDGTKQVTYAGMPLYFFAADTAAGETKGQGVGEKWYVVDAAGTVIK
jgi:predicted lipoprotein with Yx(FWY)xxD motif